MQIEIIKSYLCRLAILPLLFQLRYLKYNSLYDFKTQTIKPGSSHLHPKEIRLKVT